MPRGNWIFDKTSTGGGVFIPSDAPPVTIGTPEVPSGYEVEELYDGRFEVRIFYTPAASATAINYKGVQVWLEDPDVSDTSATPMDDSVPMDGSNQMAGHGKPQYENDDTESPVVLMLDGQPKDRLIRVYLLAFANVKNATLVRANDETMTPTPNIQIPIPAAAGKYVNGQEYAWLVTEPTAVVIPDYEHPDGAKYRLRFGYKKPDPSIPLPPGMELFGGVRIIYQYEDGSQLQGPLLEVDKPDTWISEMYDASTINFRCFFCSVDIIGRANTPVLNLTPSVLISIVYPPAGQGGTPDVTAFSATNKRYDTQPDGTIILRYDLKWTPPAARRFAGVRFFVTLQAGHQPVGGPYPLVSAGNTQTLVPIEFIGYPAKTEQWQIAAIAVDTDGKLADVPANLQTHTPRILVDVGPPAKGDTGQEYAQVIWPINTVITTEQELNSDGVVMMRHNIKWDSLSPEPDNRFGGLSFARVTNDDLTGAIFWDAKKSDFTLVTPWEPAPDKRTWKFYVVTRDMQDRRNSILPGVTPLAIVDFTPMTGNVLATRLPKDWWNPAEFDWPAGDAGRFTAKQFVSEKIYVGSILRVGGGSTAGQTTPSFDGFQNGQIAVYNNSNVLRGWIGEHVSGTPASSEHPENTTPHVIHGGWFSELYVGGDSPVNAPLYANQTGAVIIGGFDVQAARYPYISIRRHDGVEVGRVGARIGYNMAPFDDPAFIAGAWFRELAVGGQSLNDWRILCRRDPTNLQTGADLVNMRNINKFTIDYAANWGYPATDPRPNAAMHLEFGYDAFAAPIAGNWKFPGITLNRAGMVHGITIINRGIVLSAPGNNNRVALVTFNGDPTGSDTPNVFWGVLTMSSATSQKTNVTLSSGSSATNGSSYFYLYNDQDQPNFTVDGNGNVYIKGTLTLASGFAGDLKIAGYIAASSYWTFNKGSQIIDSNGQFVGNGGVSTGGAVIAVGGVSGHDFSINLDGLKTSVITQAFKFIGSGGVDTLGPINGQRYDCGSVPVIDSTGQFVGKGASVGSNTIATDTNGHVRAGRFHVQWTASVVRDGVSSGSFRTADNRTVTVSGGIITDIT